MPNAGVSQRRPAVPDFLINGTPEKGIAAEQTRWRVILTNERTCSRSKFGSKENNPGAPRSRRGFDGVADRRRCDELDHAG